MSRLKGKEEQKAVGIIHRVYLMDLINKRKYTASTKTKSEVKGGGRKPWRQKGTGNARAGSRRSPLWVGGGIIFGPKPRLVSKKINKKERKLALQYALDFRSNEEITVNQNIFAEFNSFKTKDALKLINTFENKNGIKLMELAKGKKILLILEKPNKLLWYAFRNLKNIQIITANCLSLHHVLNNDFIIR
jgi:large subunit ribosomal protein L4